MNKKKAIAQEMVYAVLAILVMLAIIFLGPSITKLFKSGLGYAYSKDDNLVMDDGMKVLSPPNNLIAVPQAGKKIIISWLKSNSPKVISYSVIREKAGGSPVNVCDLQATASESYSCLDDKPDLEIGEKYIYTVIVYDINGEYGESTIEASPNR